MEKIRRKRRNGRVYLFDNLKFFLILTVVIGHFADVATSVSPTYRSLFLFIYTFHMPLFIFLSGLFHKNKDILQKVVTFFLLGYLSKIIIWLTKLIFFGINEFEFFSDSGLPWYMFVLAMYIPTSYLLRKVDKTILLAVSVTVACIAGYFDFIGDFLYLSRFLVFFPFYLLGQMTPKIVLINLTKIKPVKIISAVVLIIWLVLCFTNLDSLYILRPLFTGRNPYSSDEAFKVTGFFFRLLCYIITSLVSLALLCLTPRRKIDYISDFGKNTIQVYFWHTSILLILMKIGLDDFLTGNSFGRFVWIILAVALTVLLSTDYFAFPTKQTSMLCKKVFSKSQ